MKRAWSAATPPIYGPQMMMQLAHGLCDHLCLRQRMILWPHMPFCSPLYIIVFGRKYLMRLLRTQEANLNIRYTRLRDFVVLISTLFPSLCLSLCLLQGSKDLHNSPPFPRLSLSYFFFASRSSLSFPAPLSTHACITALWSDWLCTYLFCGSCAVSLSCLRHHPSLGIL